VKDRDQLNVWAMILVIWMNLVIPLSWLMLEHCGVPICRNKDDSAHVGLKSHMPEL